MSMMQPWSTSLRRRFFMYMKTKYSRFGSAMLLLNRSCMYFKVEKLLSHSTCVMATVNSYMYAL